MIRISVEIEVNGFKFDVLIYVDEIALLNEFQSVSEREFMNRCNG